jgi:hypothetical protein
VACIKHIFGGLHHIFGGLHQAGISSVACIKHIFGGLHQAMQADQAMQGGLHQAMQDMPEQAYLPWLASSEHLFATCSVMYMMLASSMMLVACFKHDACSSMMLIARC